MSERDSRQDSNGVGVGLAGIGVVALAVVCCSALPLVAAFAGSIALGAVLGVGAGVVALVGLVALVVLRARRRAACATPESPPAAIESPPPV